MSDLRLMGQEVTIRFTKAGDLVAAIDSIGSFNDNVMLEVTQSDFLGEETARFDDKMNGYSFDLEFQVANSLWTDMQEAIIDRAKRKTPEVQFSVIRVDKYSNGDTVIYTYIDVKFGNQPTSIPARGDYVKVKAEGKCSDRSVNKNGISI